MRSVAIVLINLELWVGVGLICLPFSCSPFRSIWGSAANPQIGTEHFSQPSNVDVAAIARQVTVRVLTAPGAGSGVLIDRQGNTYIVLTCDHVIAESEDDRFTILTSDGTTHSAHQLTDPSLNELDLALLSFDSDIAYEIVTFGNPNHLDIGAPLYAAGFPNYRFSDDQNSVENTQDLGTEAYQLTVGEFSMQLERSLSGGYRLGYTNEVEQGMSGGPVLDVNGQLVGINGRLKHPLQGINAYLFTDGTRPSEALFQQMEVLSWAIPITSFQQTVDRISSGE